MYLLDTNVVSELRKVQVGRADAHVAEWARQTSLISMYLSAITVFETERGILLVERRDPVQAATLRGWFDKQLMATFQDRVLPVDAPVARRAANLHVPNPRPAHDAFIAASALVHGMTVITRNVADFKETGVRVFNPWID